MENHRSSGKLKKKKKHPKLPKRNDKQHYDDECLYT